MLLLGGASEESTLCEDITMSSKELVAQTYILYIYTIYIYTIYIYIYIYIYI